MYHPLFVKAACRRTPRGAWLYLLWGLICVKRQLLWF